MSLLNTTLYHEIESGAYMARVISFNEIIPENSKQQSYVAVVMRIDGTVVTERWFASRLPYIMKCLRKQFHMEYVDVTLLDLLNTAMEHDIAVTVEYSSQYGRQINYIDEAQ